MVGYWEVALALQKAGRSLEEDAHLVLENKETSHNVGRMSHLALAEGIQVAYLGG